MSTFDQFGVGEGGEGEGLKNVKNGSKHENSSCDISSVLDGGYVDNSIWNYKFFS